MAENLALASDFDRPTKDDWLAAVTKALRGADFERTLVSTTADGLRIEPLYTRADVATDQDESGFPGFDPLLRGPRPSPRPDGAWDIRSRIDHPTIATANTQLLDELANGATSVEVVLDCGGTGVGVSCRSKADLDALLAEVLLAVAPVSLRAGAYGAIVAQWYTEILADRDVTGSEPAGSLGLDPIGTLLTTGSLPQGLDPALAAAVEIARQTAAKTPRLTTFTVTGATVVDAGASEAQELGYLLSTATYYLRELITAGLTSTQAASQITLEVTADVDIFATVAKLRALRHAWANVLRECGVVFDGTQNKAIHLTAVSSWRTWTETDPWVNLLRGTAATVGAVVGGADAVTIAPFDAAAGLPGELGRRLARNTQLVLQDESGLGRTLDPAGGSWYLESFTDQLAEAGWSYFQRLESVGGPVQGLVTLTEDLDQVSTVRAESVARRKHPITGTTEFPLLTEQLPPTTPRPEPDPRDPVALVGPATVVPPLPRARLAEPFEELRARAKASQPTIFLANLDRPAVHTARATFAANLFAAGGITAISSAGLSTAEEVAAAFTQSGATVACICSSDEVYQELAPEVASALRAAGAKRVYLAGKPDLAGVDENIFVGVNVLDVLQRLHQELEIA